MADDVENDDNWLYGENNDNVLPESNEEQPNAAVEEPPCDDTDNDPKKDAPAAATDEEPPAIDTPEENNESKEDEEDTNDAEKQNGEGSDKEDYDDSDDDVNVVIGDIKTSPTYTSLNIKRGGLLTSTAKGDKPPQLPQSGKFTVEEFDQPGTINGVPVSEFNLDSLEDKPWRKPGADITDYFNYGFNEDTWRAYCERQKRMRVNESGTGLLPLNAIGMPRGPMPIMNDNSKYSGNYVGLRKAGPPPGRRMAGSIDVIGGATTRLGGTAVGKVEPPKENVIQVMTADRREYSRKPGFPDLTVPPPTSNFEDFQPEYDFNPEPEPFYGGYEPTQDLQWGTGNSSTWQPQEIKTLTPSGTSPMPPPVPVPVPAPTPAPTLIPPVNIPLNLGPVSMPPPSPVQQENSPHHRSRSKDRERESVRRDISRDRDRERSHRRERSRSRSRRHKSRSRSPSHRSHRKKKSRRHDDSE